jgi:hypothetical protein
MRLILHFFIFLIARTILIAFYIKPRLDPVGYKLRYAFRASEIEEMIEELSYRTHAIIELSGIDYYNNHRNLEELEKLSPTKTS